ncbi:hypothetical protein JHK87_000840 [Glycine soja]|nr:hypothetical protein JHK87_000840 [Glycine soja]
MYNYHEKGRAPDLESILADFMTYQASSKGDFYSMQQQGTQFERDYSFADYQWESEWKPYYHNEAKGLFNLDDLLMQFKDTVDSMQQAFKRIETQIAWPEAQLPLVRSNKATPHDPTPARVELVPADPQSPVVNPSSFPELEAAPPSPPLIIISDSPYGETTAPPDSPAGEAADPPDSPVGGAANLSDSSSGEVVALTDSPVSPFDR